MSTITYGSSALGYTDGFTRDAERHLRLVAMPATDARPVRLTRRGRLAVVAVALVVLALGVVAFGDSSAATGEAPATTDHQTLIVQPGQTIWDIAATANPHGDIRDTVDEIIRLNALTSPSGLQMGQEIAVPVYE